MPAHVADRPAVPEGVRTTAYFVLLAVAALVLLTEGMAPIWLEEEVAEQVAQSAGVIAAVVGVIAGGLGVAYRPTRTGVAHQAAPPVPPVDPAGPTGASSWR